jgi:hypothetical protein
MTIPFGIEPVYLLSVSENQRGFQSNQVQVFNEALRHRVKDHYVICTSAYLHCAHGLHIKTTYFGVRMRIKPCFSSHPPPEILSLWNCDRY